MFETLWGYSDLDIESICTSPPPLVLGGEISHRLATADLSFRLIASLTVVLVWLLFRLRPPRCALFERYFDCDRCKNWT